MRLRDWKYMKYMFGTARMIEKCLYSALCVFRSSYKQHMAVWILLPGLLLLYEQSP